MRCLFIILVSICVSNCSTTPWPIEGEGGSVHVLGTDYTQIEEMETKLSLLEKCGAKAFAAIEYRDADVTLLYLKRSHAAGDETFAQREYSKLERLFKEIEVRLPNKKCLHPPAPPKPIVTKSPMILSKSPMILSK